MKENWATGNAELYSLLAKHFNKKGETDGSGRLARREEVQPKNGTIARTLALTLAQVGETPEAMQVLNGMIKGGTDDLPDETHGILARCHKDLAGHAASEEEGGITYKKRARSTTAFLTRAGASRTTRGSMLQA